MVSAHAILLGKQEGQWLMAPVSRGDKPLGTGAPPHAEALGGSSL